MVADPIARLDHDQVEAQRQMRQQRAVRQRAAFEEPIGGGPYVEPFPGIDGLLRQPERTAGAPANLDGHEHPGRARVDRDQVQLITPDVDVPPEDRPAAGRQAIGDQLFGGISGVLGVGPHRRTLAKPDRLRLIHLPRAGLNELEIRDRDREQRVGRRIAVERVLVEHAFVEPLAEQVERDLVARQRPL